MTVGKGGSSVLRCLSPQEGSFLRSDSRLQDESVPGPTRAGRRRAEREKASGQIEAKVPQAKSWRTRASESLEDLGL